jgi:hypothetical protein
MPQIPHYAADTNPDPHDWEAFDRAIRSDAPLATAPDDPDDPDAYWEPDPDGDD